MKRHLVRICIILLTLVSGVSSAQPQIDLWREYDAGSTWYEKFEDVYRYSSGGYLACGTSGLTGWATKLSEEGNPEWNFLLDSTLFASNIEADNGDAIVGGMIWRGPQMFGVVRLDGDGEVVWSQLYCPGWCSAVIELKEGDFMLAGTSGHSGYISRIEPNGDQVWGHEYRVGEPEGYHSLYSMRETDDGVVAAGRYRPVGEPDMGWIIKVGFDGREIWSRRYDEGVGRVFFSIVSDPRGGFVVGGQYWQDWIWGSREHKFSLMQIGADGAVRTDNFYHLVQGRGDMCFGMNKLRDGFIIVGYTQMQGFMYPLALRVNRSLEPIWSLTFNDQVEDRDPGRMPNTPTKFGAAVVGEDGSIIACGGFMSESAERGQDALLCRLEPAPLGPQVFYMLPEDSINTILPGDSIQFIVRARNRAGVEMTYEWALNDTVIHGNDTTVTIKFDELGDYPVTCLLSDADAAFEVGWMIRVRDFFIVSHTPDTLSLALRRGTSQTFSIDSVAAVEGDPVSYQWTLTDVNTMESTNEGIDFHSTVEFIHTGYFRLEGLAYRGGSRDNVIWDIAVRSVLLDFWPRELSLSVLADSLVNFGVLPFNPASDSLSYRWEVDEDSVGSDSTVSLRFVWDGQAEALSYRVAAIVMDGAEGDTVRWEVTVQDPNATPPTPPSIEGGEVPTAFGITSVSPNPFNNSTTIRFVVPSASSSSSPSVSAVNITLHDLTGREVRKCVSAEVQAGEHSYTLNGADLPAGIYLLNLRVGNLHKVAKVAIVR